MLHLTKKHSSKPKPLLSDWEITSCSELILLLAEKAVVLLWCGCLWNLMPLFNFLISSIFSNLVALLDLLRKPYSNNRFMAICCEQLYTALLYLSGGVSFGMVGCFRNYLRRCGKPEPGGGSAWANADSWSGCQQKLSYPQVLPSYIAIAIGSCK